MAACPGVCSSLKTTTTSAMLRVLLEDDGYVVIEAADGETAIARTMSEQPDLVLLDLRLPGRHGLEVVLRRPAT